VPPALAAKATQGIVESAVKGASWRGRLVTVPFWANTQLLWYRKSMVEGTGLDMSKPVTWDQLIQAAEAKGKQIAAQGARAESLTVWFNALVSSAGGAVITNPSPDDPAGVQLGLNDPPAVAAGEVMQKLAASSAAGPTFSTEDEDAGATAFENGDAMFMVNWPFVWPRATSAVEEGTLDRSVPQDYGAALYPQVEPNLPSAPPYGGINLGVGAFSAHPDLAFEATECITGAENQKYYFVENGNPAALESVYSDPEVIEAFPMAPTILQSLNQAAPRPQTAYYSEVSGSIQREYHPPSGVDPAGTAGATATLIQEVLAKKELL
jgi:multiple sugar transport system substrate-binding protein